MMRKNFIAGPRAKRIGKWLLTCVLGGTLALALTKPLLVMTGLFAHDESSSVRQILYFVLVLLALLGALLHKGFDRLIALPVPIIIVLAWFSLTTTWSTSPLASFQKLALTSLVTWLCFVTSDRVTNKNIILTARLLLVLLLVANYLAVILYPSVGVHDYASLAEHKWRGIMSHKNIAGITSAITVLFFVFYGEKDTIIPRYSVVFFSVIFLYFSDSRTSMIGLVISLLIGLLFYRFSSKTTKLFAENGQIIKLSAYSLCALLCMCVVLLTFNIDFLIQATSNPEFLSGRSQIWQPLLRSYAEHPVFGTGYGAFWNNFANSADYITHEKGNFFTGATQGHNGYLDIAVQTGLLGLLISVAAIIVWPIYYLARLVSFDKNVCSLTLSMVILYIINNFTETSLFEGDNILHVFTMITFGMLWKGVRRTTGGDRSKYKSVIRKRRSVIQ